MRIGLMLSVLGSFCLFFIGCGDETDPNAQQSMPVGYGQACASSGDCISDLCHPTSLRCTIACTDSVECGTGAACEGGLCVFGASNPGGGNTGGGNTGGGNTGGGNTGGGNTGGGNTGGGNTGGGSSTAQTVDVYQVKTGLLADDTLVTIAGVVTATRINAEGQYSHLVLQSMDSGGPDNSGIWVYLNNADDETLKTNPPGPGSQVTITGQVNNFYDQWQIQHVESYTVQGMSTLPTPTIVSSTEVATGGSRAMALEGTLVTVQNVEVTELEPPAGPGDGMDGEATYEFVVDGQLRVNDYFYRMDPLPGVGTRFSEITGVLRWGNAHSKLEPRGASDYR